MVFAQAVDGHGAGQGLGGSLARSYVPEMEEPYYTWERKIVEKSSLKGREQPLV